MNLRRTALLSGLLLNLALTPIAWSQAPPRRPTMTERIGALGRSLAGGFATEEEAEKAVPAAAVPRPQQRAGFPQVDAQSLLPTNRFGSRPAQPSHMQQQPVNSRQARAGSNLATRAPSAADGVPAATDAARTAQRSQTTPIGDSQGFEEHYVLPGLGGSPLPPAAAGNLRGSSGGAASAVVTDEPSDQAAAEASSNSSQSRSFPTAASAGGAARTSPQRRAPTHVDAGDLRHELAGAYPAPTANSVPPVHESTLPAEPPLSNSPSNSIDAAQPSGDSVFTLPVNEADAEGGGTPGSDNGVTSTPPHSDDVSNFGFNQQPESSPPQSIPSQMQIRTSPPSTLPTRTPAPAPSGGRRFFGESGQPLSAEPNVLVMNQAPIISTDIRGPKQIVVGREATFHVRVHNQGNSAADGVDVSVRVPSWADIVSTSSTSGSVAQAPTSEVAGTLKWQLIRLDAGASESLELRLVPRSSRPLELAVNWTVAPVGSRAVVEVQEPKLDMNVSGPDEVLFGRPQIYRFTLSNPGTGVAENVRIELYPPGGGEKAAATNQIGNLPPGKSQTIEVELVARDSGKLAIKAVAAAEGDLTCIATKEVFCRKPELSVDWRGPDMKYAGTEATYFIRVRNPGTAPAEDVTVRATLPEGAQLTSASEGQAYDASRREIAWRVGSLGPGDDYFMELKCNVTAPGKNQLRFTAATASGDLSDSKVAETNVVALADLKLEVSDPSGPVAISDEAVYEIRVLNRGASAAKDVNVVALFSAGIEPIHVDGGQYSVSDGRVSFRAIEELPAGRQVMLRIRAKANEPGTHVFRAEVLCRDLEIKLAAEETTRFFADDASTTSSDAQNQQADSSDGFGAVR